jgi:signal transduction histidine kinase
MRLAGRFWPRRVRARLATLYALLFLVAGSGLLALTYGLLASRLPKQASPGKSVLTADPGLARLCKQAGTFAIASQPGFGPLGKVPVAKPAPASTVKIPGPARVIPRPATSFVQKCKLAFEIGARLGSRNQRDSTLNTLLVASLIGLAVATLGSAGLGWLISGRALRPVRSITETARRASEQNLGERLALDGPQDELKELADTFDEMLARLDAAFAAQQRFVANAAHELRTPLTAMRTAIEVTLSKPGHTAEQLESMALRVKRSVARAEATVEALLTLATSEIGAGAAEPVDLATAAEDALDTCGPTIARLGLAVQAELEPAPAGGDPVLLERLIANLVDNAVRHNTEGGFITLRTGENGGGAAVFEIENSGPHVPEETIPALFEPFGRAEQRLNPTDGVGLGLSIARAISVAHGATLTARSRPEGGLVLSVVVPQPS